VCSHLARHRYRGALSIHRVARLRLFPSLAQRVTNAEVLRILLGIGPTETSHFMVWHDKAGNFIPITDPTDGLTFPDLNNPANVPAGFTKEDFQTNLIMPEPPVFLRRALPGCSVIRPTAQRAPWVP
jgi:hypothetical protein